MLSIMREKLSMLFRKLVPTLALQALVWWNYRQRERGVKPDEWYWADLLLIERGILGFKK